MPGIENSSGSIPGTGRKPGRELPPVNTNFQKMLDDLDAVTPTPEQVAAKKQRLAEEARKMPSRMHSDLRDRGDLKKPSRDSGITRVGGESFEMMRKMEQEMKELNTEIAMMNAALPKLKPEIQASMLKAKKELYIKVRAVVEKYSKITGKDMITIKAEFFPDI